MVPDPILPEIDVLLSYLTIAFGVLGVILIALWLSLIVWAFRDMRRRSRDLFAQILTVLVVAALPFVGVLIYLILRPPETLTEAFERALEEEALLQEIEERPSCPGCSRIVRQEWLVCPYCHTYLKKKCVQCQENIDLQWAICPFCAAPQEDEVEVVDIDEIATTAATDPP
ncbi:MAG: zinc ribbon domain-containing protein [Ardenticatenaceae bacterium]|nr:zinc ribbon domain-containing protein [Ardenticatenaceae bacterium]